MRIPSFLKANKALFLVLIALVLYLSLSIVHHLTFKTAAFDLGIYDQTVWLYSRFHLPFSSLKEELQLADHFGPILIFFAPIYFLFSDPKTLLVIQAFLLALGGIPPYLLAKEKLGEFFAIVLLFGYLSFIGIQYAVEFDFHLAAVSVFFLSWTYYFGLKKFWKYYWIFFSLAIICKEDVSMLLVGLGIYLFFFVSKKMGFLSILIAGIYFLLIQFVIMKALGSDSGYLNYDSLGKTPVEMFSFVFLHPLETLWILTNDSVKQHTQEAMFSSFSYLPFFSLFGWLTLLPHLAERFLSSYSGRWQLFWHYTVNSTPSLVFGTILAVDFLVKTGQKIGLNKKRLIFSFSVLLLVTICFRQNLYQPPLWNLTRTDYWKKSAGVADAQELIKKIPKDASVLAQSPLVPQISQRKEIYLLGLQKKKADYVFFDLDLDNYPYLGDELKREVTSYLTNSQYHLVQKLGNSYLFQKKSP